MLADGDTAADVYSAEVEVFKAQRSEVQRLLHPCKIFARGMKAFRPSRSIPGPAVPNLSMLLDRDFANRMTQLYISRFESAFRILHVPSFWTEYEQYWRNPTETSSAVQFKIKLVIAIGSSLYRSGSDTDMVRSVSAQWVYAAQSFVSGPMEKDQLSLDGLQVQCLLILARQFLYISGDLIWIAVGTLARTAMQMGLHRDHENFANMAVL